jgi:hypothetical protein
MGFSFVSTRKNGGGLDAGKRRRTSGEVEEGAKGNPDLVAVVGEDAGGRRSGRRRRSFAWKRHGRESPDL